MLRNSNSVCVGLEGWLCDLEAEVRRVPLHSCLKESTDYVWLCSDHILNVHPILWDVEAIATERPAASGRSVCDSGMSAEREAAAQVIPTCSPLVISAMPC
jgi:hypothetical protein